MYKPIAYFTISVFGLGVVAKAIDSADVPYVFGDDGFVAVSSTGSASSSSVFTVQNMVSGEEIHTPPLAPRYAVNRSRTDPSSGSST